MRATDLADVWSLALAHDTLVTFHPDNGASYPMLEERPRAEGGAFVLRLREGITASNGAALDAEAVIRCWSAARGTAPGRLALALLAPMDPFAARGPREIVVRASRVEALEEFLGAPCMAPTVAASGGARAGVGPFAPEGGDANTLVRNAMCPRGAAYLERVTLAPQRARDDELRAFATGELDASWWGTGLYGVSREAARVTGAPAAVVGIVPTPGGPLASAAVARALEVALAPLARGASPLRPMPSSPPLPGDASALASALAARGATLRLARDPGDALLAGLAERVVALLDGARVAVMLVGPDESPDASLRAVAPMGRDGWLALASFLAASAGNGGDEAGASAVARTPRAQRGAVATGVWGRGVIAVLGRLVPALHLRAGVRGARFDDARLALGDAWVG